MPETKRQVIGQIIVCQGCCCGATHKDRPAIPAEWLKDESQTQPSQACAAFQQRLCRSV